MAKQDQNSNSKLMSIEKMTQAGDGSIWKVNISQQMDNVHIQSSRLNNVMTCQELLAFSVTFSAVLVTGKTTLDCLYASMSKNDERNGTCKNPNAYHNCCKSYAKKEEKKCQFKLLAIYCAVYKFVKHVFGAIRKVVKALVDHKYFQQGILVAILINTLSMGIEYHDQPDELTSIVETSNFVFSTIFAIEMILKLFAEGPVKYISNGFNLFDGIIVILR